MKNGIEKKKAKMSDFGRKIGRKKVTFTLILSTKQLLKYSKIGLKQKYFQRNSYNGVDRFRII